MATKTLPAKAARQCAVNSPSWESLIPDQKACSKETVRPAAALCERHEKMLPKGWRKMLAAQRVARRTQREGAKAKTAPKKLSAKARRDEYAAIVARLEAEGATTSDAQGAADVELHERGLCEPKTCPLHRPARAIVSVSRR